MTPKFTSLLEIPAIWESKWESIIKTKIKQHGDVLSYRQSWFSYLLFQWNTDVTFCNRPSVVMCLRINTGSFTETNLPAFD